MQKSVCTLNRVREGVNPSAFADPLDIELENKINAILNRIPKHLKVLETEKKNMQIKIPLAEILKAGPFTKSAPLQFNSLVKHNHLLFNSQFNTVKSQKKEKNSTIDLDKQQEDHSDQIKTPISNNNVINASALRNHQEVLTQTEQRVLRQSQFTTQNPTNLSITWKNSINYNNNNPDISSVAVKQGSNQSKLSATLLIDNENLNKRVEQALKRSEANIRRSAVFQNQSKKTNSNLSVGNESDLLSQQDTHIEKQITSTFENKQRSLSSGNFRQPSVEKGSLDVTFRQALKRSQELLRKNEEIGKGTELSTKLAESRHQISNLFTSQVQEKFTTSYKTPSKEKNLHLFHNAIRVLSPEGIYSSHFEAKPVFGEEQNGSGTFYKGELLSGKRHGRGVLNYADGSQYNGEWEYGEKCGYGTQTQPNGEVLYEGEWVSGIYHGFGNLFNPKAEKFKDSFDCTNFSSLQNNWEKFEGEFDNGKWNGFGTLHLANGEKYAGKFKYDKVHGSGTFYSSQDKNIVGEWHENKFLENL